MNEVVIAAAARTPVGRFGGAFKTVSPLELTICVMQALLERG
ncbi:MAG: hypothetical protein ACLFPD_01565 [Desulfosudaceae bacterium]